MNDKLFRTVPDEIPSPEELFHEDKKGPVSVRRQKPIPRYKVIKRFSIGFLILIVIVVLGMMNLDRIGVGFYYMLSSSMESSIPKGSFLLEYKPDNAVELKEGDIITYINSEGISITHEIAEVIPSYRGGTEPAFRTKGTDNLTSDKEYVTYDSICGKVIFHIPYVGYLLSKINQNSSR